eukprot:CAMPEP_0175058970 /NCGR_PEP_ID=MMETSP0052_2-20121109/12158_1 /TAXON_ID=51329 ORGANISM="Polytomella parva, Strain SAG 63-3" /NCGR_SAMPLE_ID=MMETSP0052_2 /ASSEMBLY_ACC=CAM_ASM_000194 /LENGTH=75 /DNA_ID=CAMNT_0016324439 /DNA_START=177 /DNA_END=404 /DNA_ORIENTATION=+
MKMDATDVTTDNFEEVFPLIESAVRRCEFYSFDFEMSGIHTANYKTEYLDEIEDRHIKSARAAESFTITQFTFFP